MILIITGCGHSGTKFVSLLFGLNHEPRWPNDAEMYAKAWEDEDFAISYVRDHFSGLEREVNSFLPPLIWVLRAEYPRANIFQLVRHPKKVIRSLMSHGQYKESSPSYRNPEIPAMPKNLSRFEKCCWHWRLVNFLLRENECPVIRLEDLRGPKVNEKSKSFPAYGDWSDEQKKVFDEIVKPEMKHYGYT